MKKKYIKPSVNNLGEFIHRAHGMCAPFGSTATEINSSHCSVGNTASGLSCYVGWGPDSSCSSGKTALNPGGCSTGDYPAFSI